LKWVTKKPLYAVVASLVLLSMVILFVRHKSRQSFLGSLTVIENEAFEVPLGGGPPTFLEEVTLELRPKHPNARASLVLVDTVPLNDTLLSERGWRIPAVLADGRPFFVPVSVKRQGDAKVLKFRLNDLPVPEPAKDGETPTLVFGYETKSSLKGLEGLIKARYNYAPKTLPLGRPTPVSLTLEVTGAQGLKDAGIAFFFRRDLPDVDIEVASPPKNLSDRSTSAAYLFLGGLDQRLLVNLSLSITAHKPASLQLKRAVIVGGYTEKPLYPALKIEGAKDFKRLSMGTVSYLGDMEFAVENRHALP
jgi:hypothetical protein